MRVYAIGDVHGRADLICRMVDLISADLEKSPIDQPIAVFLGDYVDRGPDSRGVLAHMSTGMFPTPTVCLRGNHEVMLVGFVDNPETGASWCQSGGLETLHSYGLDV